MEDEKEISRKEEDVSAIESTKNEHNSVEDNKEEDSRVDRDDRHEGGDTALSRSHLDSSSDSDSASDSDSDSDLDDEPPRLKYSRISNLPGTFFTRDPISTCTFQESIFIFATHSGTIHIAHSDLRSIRTLKAHKASILSLYTDGTYFASASMDGTVVIGSIFDEKDIIAYDFKRPVHAVILDKNYKHARSFITGGMSGKIIRSSKNWLGQRVDIVVDEGSGSPIVGIFQLQDLILWMNDEGISVYHTVTKTKISTISRPPNSPRGDMYWPRCYFPEVDRIVIAWADHIWLLRVSEGSGNGSGSGSGGAGGSGSNSSKIMIPSSATISFRATSQKVIEIEHILKLDDCLIAGISTYRDDLCIILAYNPPTNSEGKLKFHNPELKLINTTTGEITFEEEIGLRDVSNLGLNDYMLGTHIGENSLPRYFIVSAKDAVIAQEVTLEDQLNWFIGNERFLEAWKISEHLISPIKRLNLGVSYADSLIKQDKWHEIAQFLSTLLYLDENGLPDGDARSTIQQQQDTSDEYTKEVVLQWDNWSNIFIQTDHIELLTGIIPTSTKLGLSSELYTKILKYWLEENLTTFYQLLDSWDPELYDIKSIENLMEETLEADYGNDQLRRYISQLYVKSLEPMKSVNHLVILKDNNIMDFLEQHHLLGNFIDRIPDYIKLRFQKNELAKSPIDQLKIKVEDIVNLLVANRHELPSRTIVDLMIKNNLDFINNLYLEKLNDIDEYLTRGFSNERMVLYSQYDRGNS